ncbi:MATE family efflux transporter [Bradyrhizobium acaciae]|uniref:MATE family efflux transporter n=1 Tax=Bradyrhizobium acaciae TaxID=2683706 RepID=UPI001E3D49AB|nr:MATE family efflux transporter [Bradyrhizobium acaciae]MCC8977920.1 MATE family efflux transporter [Bradyrhizobium acaciae]
MSKTGDDTQLSSWRRQFAKWVARHHLSGELAVTATLATPIALTQLAQIAMMATDLAWIGHIGTDALAAAALAGMILSVGLTFAGGVISAVGPLAAQARGAANTALVRSSLRMGLWIAVVLWAPMIVLAVQGEQIVLALGQEPAIARLAQQYLFGLTWGILPALWFLAIRSFMAAVDRPAPALWITLAAIPTNALLAYLLITGKFGLPRLDLFGAGLATSLVNSGTFLAGIWFVTYCRPFRDYQVLRYLWRFDWPLMRELLVVGTPISLAIFMESGLFSATALLMGVISTTAVAAHQIAFQVAAAQFMIPFCIGMAVSLRIGHALGRNDLSGIRQAGFAAMLLGVLIAAVATVAVVGTRFTIAELFVDQSASNADATIKLTAALILVGASFFVTDALQSIAAGGLRGLRDTRVPLLFAGVAYWLIGLSVSYVLGLKTGLGAIGIWIGLSIGKAIYAALLVIRLRLLANRTPVAAMSQASAGAVGPP